MENMKNLSADGMIILCFSSLGPVRREEAEFAARNISATGLIFVEPLSRLFPDITILPFVQLDIIQGTKIAQYLAQASELVTHSTVLAQFTSLTALYLRPTFLFLTTSCILVNTEWMISIMKPPHNTDIS